MPTLTPTPGLAAWATRTLEPAGLDLDDALAALVAGAHDDLPAALVAGWTSPDPSDVLPDETVEG